MLHWCLHQGDCILQEIAQTSSPWAMVETHLTEQMGWSWSSLNRSCECLVVVVVVVVVVVCRLPTIRELVAHQGRQVPQVGSLHHVHVVVGENVLLLRRHASPIEGRHMSRSPATRKSPEGFCGLVLGQPGGIYRVFTRSVAMIESKRSLSGILKATRAM